MHYRALRTNRLSSRSPCSFLQAPNYVGIEPGNQISRQQTRMLLSAVANSGSCFRGCCASLKGIEQTSQHNRSKLNDEPSWSLEMRSRCGIRVVHTMQRLETFRGATPRAHTNTYTHAHAHTHVQAPPHTYTHGVRNRQGHRVPNGRGPTSIGSNYGEKCERCQREMLCASTSRPKAQPRLLLVTNR